MPLGQPFHQRPTRVQCNGQVCVLFEHVQERAIAVLIRGFHHTVEIADRLMVVQNNNESEIRTHEIHSPIPFGASFAPRLAGALEPDAIHRYYRKIATRVHAGFVVLSTTFLTTLWRAKRATSAAKLYQINCRPQQRNSSASPHKVLRTRRRYAATTSPAACRCESVVPKPASWQRPEKLVRAPRQGRPSYRCRN